jgi:hypothetical protein
MSSRTRVGLIAAALALVGGLWAAGFALGRSDRPSSSAARAAERGARSSAFEDAYRAAFPRGKLEGYPQGRIAGEAQGRAGGARQARLRAQLKLERRKLNLARRQARRARRKPAVTSRQRVPHARQHSARPRHVRHRHAPRAPHPGRSSCQTRLFGEGGEGEEAVGEAEGCTPAARGGERAAPEGVGRTP